jgi:two-component system nitrogen regulation response regulator NtrX
LSKRRRSLPSLTGIRVASRVAIVSLLIVASVLVIDDDKAFRLLVEEALSAEGFEVRSSGTLARGLAMAQEALPDVVLLDRRLPDGDGIDAIQTVHLEGPAAVPIIVVTADSALETATAALRAGADFMTKPIQLADLVVKVHKVLERRRLYDRLQLARSNTTRSATVTPNSERLRLAYEVLTRAVASPLAPVLLSGPRGSGKRHAAIALHAQTFRGKDSDAPFAEVDRSGEDVTATVFGSERGRGLIERAAGGTLYISEVAALPPASQAALLELLRTMRFRRPGHRRELAVDVRVIAATSSDLREAVRRREFLEELLRRLAAISVAIPPLSERPEDIPELALSFARSSAERARKRVTGIAAGALRALQAYEYPGNVRELRNIVERAVVLARDGLITERDLLLTSGASAAGDFFHVGPREDGGPLSVDDVKRAYVCRVLEHYDGRSGAAAEGLGLSLPRFQELLLELGLQ